MLMPALLVAANAACSSDDCQRPVAGKPYDTAAGCYREPEHKLFCDPNPNVQCAGGWVRGEIVTAPNGSTWYVVSPCFSVPPGWERQYAPALVPVCQ